MHLSSKLTLDKTGFGDETIRNVTSLFRSFETCPRKQGNPRAKQTLSGERINELRNDK